MALTPAHIVEKGAMHVLSILKDTSPVRYSVFYDGEEKTSDALAVALGLEEAKDWYCVEHIIDLAVYELEVQGIVGVRELPDLLVDDTNDFEITLTDKGRQLNCSVGGLKFWDAE